MRFFAVRSVGIVIIVTIDTDVINVKGTGGMKMKVIVEFTDIIFKWSDEILNAQSKKGYIEVKKLNDGRYEMIENNLPDYILMPEWVTKVIEDET
jgi:hypothetical protein